MHIHRPTWQIIKVIWCDTLSINDILVMKIPRRTSARSPANIWTWCQNPTTRYRYDNLVNKRKRSKIRCIAHEKIHKYIQHYILNCYQSGSSLKLTGSRQNPFKNSGSVSGCLDSNRPSRNSNTRIRIHTIAENSKWQLPGSRGGGERLSRPYPSQVL